MFVASVIAYMDRANRGFAQLGMGVELGITAATYGAIAAAFFISYFIFEIPSNMLLERFGARRWIARIMLSWGLVTILTGFVNSVPTLYIARVMLGIAEAGFFPGMVLYLALWFPARQRAVALGWFIVAQPVAYVMSGLFGGVILDHVDWLGLSPWRWVFIFTGIPAVIWAVVVFKFLPDSPKKASWLSDKASTWMVQTLDAERGPAVKLGARAELGALRSPRVLHLAAILLAYGIAFYGFNVFVPLILKQINPTYSSTNIGFTSVIPYVLGAIGVLVAARLARNTARLPFLGVGLLLCMGIGLSTVIAFSDRPGIALVGLALAAIGCFGFLPAFWALSTVRLPRLHAAVGIAAINSIANLGGFVGPYMVGQSTVGNTVTIGLLLPVISIAVSIVLILFLRRIPARTQPSAVANSN